MGKEKPPPLIRSLTEYRLGEMDPDGWVEIGKRCSAGRRSTWMRIIYMNPPSADEELIGARLGTIDKVEAVELRAGREGGDSYVRIDKTNPQFDELYDLLTTALFAAES